MTADGSPSDSNARTDSPDDRADADDERADAGDDPAGTEPRVSRRNLLGAAATTGIVAGVGGVVSGQQSDEPLDPAETIVLGGEASGWVGRDPQRINGTVNPTLNLAQGETYDLTWINVDGLPHNIAFLDAQGNVLRKTEIISQQGAEQSISYKASGEERAYVCQVHPNSMRGRVVTGDGEQTEVPEPAQALVPKGPEVGLRKVAGEPLTQPIAFRSVTVNGTEHRFVADQTGEVYRMTDQGLTEFLDVSDRLVMKDDGFDERGLLGLAFHPNFGQNRKFYVRYSGHGEGEVVPEDYDHMFVLAEFTAAENFQSADPESERRLLQIPEPQFNHNAGAITFGPDGYLYVTVGDGGGADDTGVGHVNDWYERNGGGNGQDLTTNLLGSILRIDVDSKEGNRPYGIPQDNPLVGQDGLDEMYAWGFRNPWRMSFNDGELIVADVGQNLFEEIDRVRKGGNYGWNVREGFHCFSTENPNDPTAITNCPTNAPNTPPHNGQPLLDPVLEYPHSVKNQVVGLSVTGGYVYTNNQLSSLQGKYVFGDWSASFGTPAGRLWVADLPQQGQGKPTDIAGGNVPEFPMRELVVAGSENGEINRTVNAFGRDGAGDLYVLTSQTTTINGTGEVFKLVPPGQGDQVGDPTTATPTPEPTGTGTATGNATGTGTPTGTGTATGTGTGTTTGDGTSTGTGNGTDT